MRSIDLDLRSTNSGETAGFRLALEQNVSGQWRQIETVNIASGTPQAVRSLQIERDQRIVIEAIGADVEMVFDKEQNATMPRVAFETKPTEDERREMEEARQKELRETARGEEKLNQLANRAADRARENVLAQANAPAKPSVQSAKEDPRPGTPTSKPSGMTAPGPSTGGSGSTEVKKNG